MSDDNSTNTTATSVTSSLAELPLSPGDRELDPLASIDTGNPDRDAHTRSADLLDVAKRPTMSFRSTRVSGADEDWTMEGDLTIGDVTRPITFAVEVGGVAVFPHLDQRNHAGFEATGEIRRSDYGLDFGTGLLSDAVKIHLDMQFIGPEGADG